MTPLDLVKSLMEEFIKDNKLVIIAEPKTIYFDLPVDVDNNLKYQIDFIIKYNEFLAEHTIKKIVDYCLVQIWAWKWY